MILVAILYGHPQDPQEFERYYAETHLPLAAKMKGVDLLELTRFGPDLLPWLACRSSRQVA